jgi:hypothetical protein
MSAVKKSPRRKSKTGRAKARSFSTSEGRANFAEALETANREKTIIGFDRYGHPIAALVPIDAVKLLAGQGGVEPDVRDRIIRGARSFMAAASLAAGRAAPAKPKKPAAKKAKGAKTKTKRAARSKALGKQA